MKRADAQKAIDDAFSDGLKHTFSVLVLNLMGEKPSEAVEQFRSGIAIHDEAYAQATRVIEQIFSE